MSQWQYFWRTQGRNGYTAVDPYRLPINGNLSLALGEYQPGEEVVADPVFVGTRAQAESVARQLNRAYRLGVLVGSNQEV
jgi:hypothetical protein